MHQFSNLDGAILCLRKLQNVVCGHLNPIPPPFFPVRLSLFISWIAATLSPN